MSIASNRIADGLGAGLAKSNTQTIPSAAQIEEAFQSKAVPLADVRALEMIAGEAADVFGKYSARTVAESERVGAAQEVRRQELREVRAPNGVVRNELARLAREAREGSKSERVAAIKRLGEINETARASRPMFGSVAAYLNMSTIDSEDRRAFTLMLANAQGASLATLAAKAASDGASKDPATRKKGRALMAAVLDRYDSLPKEMRDKHKLDRHTLASQVAGVEFQRGLDALDTIEDAHGFAREIYSAHESGRRVPARALIARGLAKGRGGQ